MKIEGKKISQVKERTSITGNEMIPFQDGNENGKIKLSNIASGGGTTDYSKLNNKPSIEGVELSGDKTLSDIGAASKTDLSRKQDTITRVNVTVGNSTGIPSGTASVSGNTLNINLQNIKGEDGSDGEPGQNGPANVLTIGSVTEGEKASASITGDSPNQILNLVLPKGPKGEDGTSISILGSYESLEELQEAHPTGNVGDGYLVQGDLYIWSETQNNWSNVGNIQGPKGDKGETGTTPKLQVVENNLQVSYNDGSSWETIQSDLVPEATIATSSKIGGITANSKSDEYTEEVKIDSSTGKLYTKPSSKIEQATSTSIGGIKAESKTDYDTVEVKIDSATGKLYVEPIGGQTIEYINNADDEDLTEESVSEQKVLKFANKDHNSGNFSGLGRVYLRKNMSSGKNTLTQSMINKPNTRYIVQYDYDLNGAEINMPDNCVFDFQGGSFKNGIINGNKVSIAGIDTYNILNDTIIKDFSIEYIDVRWVGAVSEENPYTSEVDSAPYFKRAVELTQYNKGCSVRVIGRYRIASTVETERDLKIFGVYKNNRTFSTSFDVDENNISEIYVDGCSAFKMLGRGTFDQWKNANFYINNLIIKGSDNSSGSNVVFLEYQATGAPTRVGLISDIEVRDMGKLLYVHNDENYTAGTGPIYANLVIDRIVAYGNDQFLVAKTTSTRLATLLNIVIRDSNIEQNRGISIEIESLNGPLIIENCIFENEPTPIKINSNTGSIDIRNNYFEDIDGNYLEVVGNVSVINTIIRYYGNTVNNSGNIYLSNVTIDKFDKFVINNWDYECTFDNCYFKDNYHRDIKLKNISDQCLTKNIAYVDTLEESDFYFANFGYDDIKNGILGIKLNSSVASYAKVEKSLSIGDKVTVVTYSTNGGFNLAITDYKKWGASANKSVWSSNGIQISTFEVTAESPDYFYITANSFPDYDVSISNAVVFINNENITIDKVGIPPLHYLQNKILPNNSNTGKAKDKFLFSNGNYHNPYYTDGADVRNLETSLYSNVKIVKEVWDGSIFSSGNIIKVAGNMDLGGETKNFPENCILDFSLGGTVTNGTLNLNGTLLYPLGMNTNKYLKNVSISGTYGIGQILYDGSINKLKYYDGTSWKYINSSES